MKEMKTLTFPNGEQYEIVDEKARQDIKALRQKVSNLQMVCGSWEEIAIDIGAGLGKEYYPVASQVEIPWKRIATAGAETAYEPVHNVVHHGGVVYSEDDGVTEVEANGMYLEWDKTIPDGLAFCASQALQCFDGTEGSTDGLPAGKYAVLCTSFSSGWSNAKPVYLGKYLVFTLTKPIPSGGVIIGVGISNAASGWQFRTCSSYLNNKSTIETVDITPMDTCPDDATYLGGTWGEVAGYGKLNHIECVAYGDNTWETSDYRQWLNSDEVDWWKRLSRYHMQPSQATTIRGYLTGLPDEFKAQLKPVKCQQYTNTAKGDGTLSTTYDRIFIRSNSQANITTNDTVQYGEPYTEGEIWDYYKILAEGQDNLDAQGRFKIYSTYPILISYAINAPTTAQYVFGRSALGSNAYVVFNVSTTGNCSTSYARYGYRCRPACVICGKSPDATQSGV